MEGDKGRVEREQQGGHGGERGEVLVLKTALDLREDMKRMGTVGRWVVRTGRGVKVREVEN